MAAVSIHNYRNDFVFRQFTSDHAAQYKAMESSLEEMESSATADAQKATASWKGEIVAMKALNATEKADGLVEATRKTADAFALSQSENVDVHRMQTEISEALSKFQGSATLVPSLSPTPPAAPTPAPSVALPSDPTSALAGAGPPAAPVAAPAAALAVDPAAALAVDPGAALAAVLVAAPAAAPAAAPLTGTDTTTAPPAGAATATATAATKIAVKGSDSVIDALNGIQLGDAHFEAAVALKCAIPKACARIYKAICAKTKSAGGAVELPDELQNTAVKGMVFTPEAYDAGLFRKMHAGHPAEFRGQASGGFCIENGKTIEQIMIKLGSSSSIVGMNTSIASSRNRIFTLYMQQFMASGDKTALAILNIFEVSPSTV